MKKHLLLYFFLLGLPYVYAQILVKDCKTQQPIFNAIIYNAVNNQVIGTTDSDGKIDLPPSIQDIVLAHPAYGIIPTINQAVICIDELLNPIIIEVKKDAKEELIAILKNSYQQYSIDPFKEQYYYYKGTIYENDTLGNRLSQEEGYVKNFTFYNTSFILSSQLMKYTKIADPIATSPVTNERLHYFFFSNKKQFYSLLKILKKLKVKKINQDYYVYNDTWDNYWLFEIDTTKNRIRKFVSTAIEAKFFDFGDALLFQPKRKLTHRLIEVNYDIEGKKVKQQLQLFDLYTLTQGETKLAKLLRINTVKQQDIVIERTYSLEQYIYYLVTKKIEMEDLVEKLEKQKTLN
ncbi:hypothetical protein [Myroides sp. DW712]|uniref:hypothetical protein n=1 Tax=Myroides sp. DW712 TaxID=3389800 RepID=UPI00397B30D7